MNFEEFREQLCKDLPGVLPADMQNVEIDFQHTEKLQNGSYDGMVIRPKGQPIGMNIDLNRFFSEYENGTSYNAGEQTASIYTADKAVMRRFDRLVADIQSSISGWKQTESSKTYSMPKSYVSYRKPRKVSDVQRERDRSKMEAINQAKNVVVN